MRSKWFVMIMWGIMLCCGGLVQAVIFQEDGVIVGGEYSDVIVINNASLHATDSKIAMLNAYPGILSLNSCEIQSSDLDQSTGVFNGCSGMQINGRNSSTLNYNGSVFSYVNIEDQSFLSVHSGNIQNAGASVNSTANLYSGAVDRFNIYGSSEFNMYDGLVGVLDVSSNSIANIQNGSINGMVSGHVSTLNLYGGTVSSTDLSLTESAFNIYGGSATFGGVYLSYGSSINIYGGSISFSSPVTSHDGYFMNVYYTDKIFKYDCAGEPVIVGYRLNDGNEFLLDQYQRIGTFTFTQIPEPLSLCLLALGGLFLRRAA